MSHELMVSWVFEEILHGLMSGKRLRDIAAGIVIGLANIFEANRKAEPQSPGGAG